MLSTFVLFSIVQLLSSAVFQVESADTQPFVLNGVDVNIEDYPHSAAILNSFGTVQCGGTIIGEFSILSVYLCCDTDSTVKVGTTKLTDAKSIPVDSCNDVVIQDGMSNSTTVIKVNESLYEAGGKAVKLVQEKDIGKFMNKEGSVVGWGQIDGDNSAPSFDNQLKRGDVKIMTLDDLKKLDEKKYQALVRDITFDERYYTVGFGEKELPFYGDQGAALTVKTSEGVVAIGSFNGWSYVLSEDGNPEFGLSAYKKFGPQRTKLDSFVSDIEWLEAENFEILQPEKTPEPTTPKPTSSASVPSSVFLALSFAFCVVVNLF